MSHMLLGAIVMASLVASLFFFRYWKTTKDRLFLFFALSFLIEAFNRLLFWENLSRSEDTDLYFLIRLVAYGLILFAILDKNMPRNKDK
ncbi:MAG: DUF5985 family protein [Pseudomonadota bacterium]